MTTKTSASRPITWTDRLEFGVIRLILAIFRVLPYRARVGFLGWVMARVIGPIAGYNKRTRDNLELIMPEMPEAERVDLARKVSNGFGRTLAEMFSAEDFLPRARKAKMTGAGLGAIDTAQKNGQPVVFISGHFGNYDVARVALIERGFDVGGLYRKMNNPLFHDYYVDKISTIGKPLFERGRSGMGQMLRHLKKGGALAALIDLRAGNGAPLQYFGKQAWTALSMAELALKYNALLVPIYGVRQPDGISYEVVVEPPVPVSDPETMTQALNDSLEARVRANMDQWFWVHRRWQDV